MVSQVRAGTRPLLAAGAMALLLFAVGAHAAIRLDAAAGSVTTDVKAPPVAFVRGPGADASRHVGDVAVSASGASVAITLRPTIGARLLVADVVRLQSDGVARAVSLEAGQVANPKVLAFTWTVSEAGVPVAVLDMRAASPSAGFVVPATGHLALAPTVRLDDTATAANAALVFTLDVVVP